MCDALFRALLGTTFPFAMTAAGAAAVFFTRRAEKECGGTLLGFAAGVMSAASVWSLLLPAIERCEGGALPAWLPAAAGLSLGALALACFDRMLRRLSDGVGRRGELLLFGAITLHNAPEGMAVGLAFALAADGSELAAAAALAFGIGIQNLPEGAAISLPLRRLGRVRAFALGAASGAVEPIFGVLAALFVSLSPLLPWLLGFAAGAMLYVAVAELIPRAHARGGTLGFMGGFLVMMVLDVALG